MQKILIVMPDKHLGNFVISLNAIIPLRNYNNEDNVGIIFDEVYQDMVSDNVGLKNIFFYPRKKLETEKSLFKRAIIYLKFIAAVRKFKPSVSVALESCNVSAIISFLSGATRRIGLDENKLPFFLNEKIPFRKNVHRLESYRDINKKLDIPYSRQLISLVTSQKNHDFINAMLQQRGLSPHLSLICIHTGAAKQYKQWPLENFIALINTLAATNNYQIMLIGGNTEYVQNEKIIKACHHNNLYDFTGCFSVNQLIALFKKTTLFICNDSGPMHVAALSNTTLISLFGPTEEKLWGPLSKNAHTLVGGTTCINHCNEKFSEPFSRCFCELTVEKVVQKINQLLPATMS